MSDPICSTCGTPMAQGFVASRSLDFTRPDDWVGGPPEASLMFGTKVSSKEHHQIVAFRCPRCSRLEFYAPDAAA